MTALVDTPVLVDYLCGHGGAAGVLERERVAAPLLAREITRLEVLAGMRPAEEDTCSPPAAALRRGTGRPDLGASSAPSRRARTPTLG
jgi:hypothetical protein